MGESSNIVVETAERIFADLCDPQTVNSAKDDTWKDSLWKALTENGLTLAWVSEEHGGVGREPRRRLRAAERGGPLRGSRAARRNDARGLAVVPGWNRFTRGRDVGRAGAAEGQDHPERRRHPERPARNVPFAREAQHFAVLAQGPKGATIALVAAKDCRREEDENLAGEPADNLIFDKTVPLKTGAAPKGFDQTSLMLMGCVARSLQISGALQYMLTRSVNYSQERVAFEKKISKFQAVQHNLAKLAGETAAAVAAAGSAADTISTGTPWSDEATFLEATAAKIRCAEAAGTGSAIAHQVHGAIGFTKEYVLHRFSLRTLGWRDDFGNESYWAVELGNMVAKHGADDLWPLVASR